MPTERTLDQDAAAPMAPPVAVGSRALVALAVLTVVHALSYFDRMLMVVFGQAIKTDLHLSDKQLALLTGATFVVVYGLVGIGGGWIADRTSRKRILAIALTVWSAATMTCGLPNSFVLMAAARSAVGAGEAATLPTALSMIADIFPRRHRPMANAIFYAGGMAGTMLSFIVGAWVATHVGWRGAFFIVGPPGLVMALVVMLVLREPVRSQADEAGSAPAPAESGPSAPQGSAFKTLLANPALCWLLLANACAQFASGGIIQWLPMVFIRSHGMSMGQIGALFGPALGGGMVLGMLLGGWIGARFAARSITDMIWFSAAMVLALIPAYLAVLWIPSTGLALGMMFVATGASVSFVPCSTAAWQSICPPQVRGTAAGILGFMSMLISAGAFPFVVGALSDLWAPSRGAESLRWALTVSLAAGLLTAALYARAARLFQAQAARR